MDKDLSTGASDPYLISTVFRQLSPTLNIPLLWTSAKGDYRINYALHQENPRHPIFSEGKSAYYRGDDFRGRLAQKLFLPKTGLETSSAPGPNDKLRRSGARLQSMAGYGLQAQLLARTGVNLFSISQMDWDPIGGSPWSENSVVVLDTASVTANTLDSALANVGRWRIHQGLEGRARGLLIRSHQFNLAGSLFQLGTGISRFSLEFYCYAQTGQMDNSTLVYGAMDSAAGGVGLAYSRYVLSQSRIFDPPPIQNTALMGRVPLPTRLAWGLRLAGTAGAALGFGVSALNFYDAMTGDDLPEETRKEKMVSSSLGMVGSGLILASAWMVNPATAPIAGVLFVAGAGVLVAQSLYDYREEIFSWFK